MQDYQASPTFDRIMGLIVGLPDTKLSRPSTVLTVMPLVGASVTYVVQTHKAKEGFTVFLQMVDAEGRARFVIPPKVADAIYRQRQSLADRSTPESRARQRRRQEREKARKAKVLRRARFSNNGHDLER